MTSKQKLNAYLKPLGLKVFYLSKQGGLYRIGVGKKSWGKQRVLWYGYVFTSIEKSRLYNYALNNLKRDIL